MNLNIFFLLLIIFSCARAPVENEQQALRLSSAPESLFDDMELMPLIEGLKKQMVHFQKPSFAEKKFVFGENVFSKEEYLQGLGFLIRQYQRNPDKTQFIQTIKKYFDFYEVYGDTSFGEVKLTSYFEPTIPGSFKKTKVYNTPLYRRPKDMVEIDLKSFGEEFFGEAFEDIGRSRFYARLTDDKSVRGLQQIIPYYSREEIDMEKSLVGRGLEICWVDPVDSFFLQIQGSGTIELPGGKNIRVGYQGQNGHKYESIGKFLRQRMPEQKWGAVEIENYLKSLSREEQSEILNKNPSYVFFKELNSRPITSLGTEVIAGRTIATDYRYFPKGALGFLIFEKPVFENSSQVQTETYSPTSRFVLDQDTGGAIKGGGRVDLFWGKGPRAKQSAGVINQRARLYYLAPKKEFLRYHLVKKD